MPPRPDRSDGVRPGGVSRLRAIDPLVPVVAGVSLVVYVLHGFHGMLTRDLASTATPASRWPTASRPTSASSTAPGRWRTCCRGWGSLVARLGGLDDVITMRVLFMLIATAAVCVSYLLGRDLFRSRGAGLVTASAMLAVHGFIQYASNGPREKTPMTLFSCCALWAVTHRRWFTAGVLTSLATLCLQTAFFSTFTAVVVGALLLARGRPDPRAGRGSPSADWCPWSCSASGSRWRGRWAPRSTASTPSTAATPSRTRSTPSATLVWDDLQVAYGVTVWLLLAGAVLLVLVLPGRRVPPGPGRGPGAGRAARHGGRPRRRARLDPARTTTRGPTCSRCCRSRRSGWAAGFAVATHGLARRRPGRRGGGARRRRRRARADVLALDPGRLPGGPARGRGRGAGDSCPPTPPSRRSRRRSRWC